MIANFSRHAGPVQAVCFAPDGRSLYSGSSDTTILQWEVNRIIRDGVLPSHHHEYRRPRRCLGKIGDAGFRARTGRGLEAGGGHKESVPFLASKLVYMDAKHIDQLLNDLNDDSYAVRFKATDELLSYCGKYGMWMRSRLEEAIRNPASEEMRYRAEQVFEKLLDMPAHMSLPQERVRLHRCLLILEQSGSPAAIDVLRKLVVGVPESITAGGGPVRPGTAEKKSAGRGETE